MVVGCGHYQPVCDMVCWAFGVRSLDHILRTHQWQAISNGLDLGCTSAETRGFLFPGSVVLPGVLRMAGQWSILPQQGAIAQRS